MKKYLFLLLFACSAHAETRINILFISVKSPWATFLQQRVMAQVAADRLHELGIDAHVKFKIVTDPFPPMQIEDQYGMLYRWQNWLFRRHLLSKKYIVHVMTPPFFDSQGFDYGGGVAMYSCSLGSISRDLSYSAVRQFNGLRELRDTVSMDAIFHELLHNLGAEHVDGENGAYENVMNSAAGQFGDILLPLADWVTKDEVRMCLKSRGLFFKGKKL